MIRQPQQSESKLQVSIVASVKIRLGMRVARTVRMDLKAHVARDILDLVPAFLRHRRSDIRLIQVALAKRDFDALEQIGEQMYAVGEPYGFRQITAFGQALRVASADQDIGRIHNVIAAYGTYLSHVGVVPVDAPPKRRRA